MGLVRLGGVLVSSLFFFFSSRRRHTRLVSDWSSDVCSSDLRMRAAQGRAADRFEREEQAYFERVREAYLRRARSSQGRMRVIDAGASVRSEERRVGKECRCRWWPGHVEEERTRQGGWVSGRR